MKERLLLIPLFLLLLTGCGVQEFTKITCTNAGSINEEAVLAVEYVIYAKGDEVHILVSTEAIRSENEELLIDLRGHLEEMYSVFNRIPFFMNNLFEEDGFLTSITMIDYNKINMDDLIGIDPNKEGLMENGRVSLRLLREFHENSGAVCE